LQKGQLLLIDEFDLSLHPLVARYLIQLFNDPNLSKNGAQLLLTSHNTNLMDIDLLRRDEIWLMELDGNAASTLLRMWHSASPPRKHELIGKRYLFGRYGAVPAIRLKETALEAARTVAVPSAGVQRKEAAPSLAGLSRIPRI
jgi:AAA15 family ATPase/GTPase